jgi:serine/alanine adding enzyme
MRSVSSAADGRTVPGALHVPDRIDERAWRAFLEAQPDSNVFHTPEMCRVFDRARHHRPNVLAATDASGTPVALLTSVEVTLVGGPLRSWTSRAVAYGGLLSADSSLGREGVRSLLASHRRATGRRPLFTELRHVSEASLVRDILDAEGFSHEDHLNYLIDLDRPEEILWGGLSRTAQQRVRSGQRKGIVIEDVTDELRLEQTYPLLDDVYKRVGVPFADRSLFQAAMSILHPRGMFRIFSARLGERIVATRYVLLHRDRIVDWYAGADRAFASFSPSEILVWQILRWGRERGYGIFDFGGAGRPAEPYGPREFKAKFGGELVNFGRDVLVQAPVRLRVSRSGYAVARRLLRRRASTRRQGVAEDAIQRRHA